jgi:hypothetical protein
MGILQFPTSIPVTVGSLPSLKFMVTTDPLASVIVPGYLNQANIDSGNPMAPTDVVAMLYNFDSRFQTGTFAVFTVSISVTGVISLVLWNPGVLLPVVANDIALFFSSSGEIYDGVNVIARHQGNIQAGLSGTQGGFISYPSSPATGNFIFEASVSAGNFTTVLTNASMGQATNFFIPDPSVTNAFLTVIPSALVNNNLVKAQGTTGLLVDTGINASNVMQNNITNTFTVSGRLIANKVNGTEAANAVTANGMAGLITTSSLTTAGGASYAITWTNSFISSTSSVLLTLSGGTNTIKNITLEVIPGAGTSTLTIYNNTAATALNGTIFISYLVI